MSAVWHALAHPWSQGIMQRALLEALLLSLSGAALGCWVVFYEASYSAESLPHAMFSLYQSSKAGLERFTEALRAELEPDGIRVTMLRAGQMTDEDFTAPSDGVGG